jgi:hypothetical protein
VRAALPYLAALVFVALGSTSCAKTYEELEPFGCARDHLCPDPYVCIADVCQDPEPCAPASPSCTATRPRCTMVRTTASTFGAQCIPPGGASNGTEGSFCALNWGDPAKFDNFAPFARSFPAEDRFCQAGTMCHTFDFARTPTSAAALPDGTCRTFCTSDGACASGSRCFDAFGKLVLPSFSYANGGTKPGLCLPSCSPLGSTCGTGSVCSPAATLTAGQGMGVCRPVEQNAPQDEGQSCVGLSQCKPGLHCVPEGNGATCRALCNVSGATSCAGSRTCDTASLALPGGAGICR